MRAQARPGWTRWCARSPRPTRPFCTPCRATATRPSRCCAGSAPTATARPWPSLLSTLDIARDDRELLEAAVANGLGGAPGSTHQWLLEYDIAAQRLEMIRTCVLPYVLATPGKQLFAALKRYEYRAIVANTPVQDAGALHAALSAARAGTEPEALDDSAIAGRDGAPVRLLMPNAVFNVALRLAWQAPSLPARAARTPRTGRPGRGAGRAGQGGAGVPDADPSRLSDGRRRELHAPDLPHPERIRRALRVGQLPGPGQGLVRARFRHLHALLSRRAGACMAAAKRRSSARSTISART
ncbi:hypothetical protein LP420_27065 [Massilia sp. B-10]|nr:hypothetical protein LP420_27065 [Massilia sp. B-10]